MKLRNIILGIGILVLTMFVVIYGISVFYPAVNYDDYCSRDYYAEKIPSQETCPAVCVPLYEIESNECVLNDCGSGCGADNVNTFETFEKCQKRLDDLNCYEDYEDAQEERSKIVFFIALPIGIILLVLGGLLFGTEAVGAGLMGGGIGTIIYGAGGYWQYSSDVLRFVFSLIGLAAVIYLAYWFNSKSKKKGFIFWKK